MILLNSNSFCHFISCNVKTQKQLEKSKKSVVFSRTFCDFASKNNIFLVVQNKLQYYRVKKNYKASNAAWKRQIYYVSGFFLSKRWRFLLIFGTSKQIKQNKPSFLLLEPNKIKTHVLLHSLIHTLIKPRIKLMSLYRGSLNKTHGYDQILSSLEKF